MVSQMKHRFATAVAIALVMCSTTIAHARVHELGTISGTTLIGDAHRGKSFTDFWNFTLGGVSDLSAIVLTFNAPPIFGIKNLRIALFDDTTNTKIGIDYLGGSFASYTGLNAGDYYFRVKGNPIGIGGAYAGAINVTPVPEPETWAFMAIGLGLIGFQLRRKIATTVLVRNRSPYALAVADAAGYQIAFADPIGFAGSSNLSPSPRDNRKMGRVLRSRIDALTWDGAMSSIFQWAKARQSRYVCLCNVHGVVTALAQSKLRKAINGADMATPDGKPIAFALALQGFQRQPRISGPDLMLKCCERAAESGVSVFLYGGTPENLTALVDKLKRSYPELKIADAYAPPFRQLSREEDDEVIRMINASGAGLVFVGLGCPKQELWMAKHKGRIHAVMLGVGAAFDFHSGKVRRAPHWMQNLGLEWLSRLLSEPKRLWRRYLITNSLFITYFLLRTPTWILSRPAR